MDFTLYVDPNTCITCGKCVRICPAMIFRQDSSSSVPRAKHIETCIRCGHCVAVCPTGAVKHSVFPADKVHAIDPEKLPAPDELMLLIKARRSNRAFSRKAIPEEYLEAIVEAAYRAPTASNQQELEFTLVTDPAVLKALIRLTADVFDEKLKNFKRPVIRQIVGKISPSTAAMAGRINALVERVKSGHDPILRGATAALFIHSAKDASYYGKIDGNLAYQNGSLMAESLGVSQFYTGFICRAMDEDKKGRFNKLLRIEGKIHAGMGLGMPSFRFPNYIDKEPIKFKKL